MAISANTILEVRTTGNDTNGGGFVAGAAGTDYSQQDSKNTVGSDISTTDAVAVGTTTITSLTANFGTTIVGNLIYFAGGTGTITGQWRECTARASASSITIDAAIAASTGMTMNIGGALASPGQAGGIKIAGVDVYIKSGTYTIANTTANTSGGPVSDTTGGVGVNNNSHWVGYGTVRDDDGTRPLLQVASSGVTSISVFKMTGGHVVARNIEVDGALKASIKGFEVTSSYFTGYRLSALNCTNRGIDVQVGTAGLLISSRASGCTTVLSALYCTVPLFNCEAFDNTVTGIAVANNTPLIRCLSYRNTGATSDGFQVLSIGGPVIECVAAYNGRSGVNMSGTGAFRANCINVIAYGNGGAGFNTDQVSSAVYLVSCAGGSNSGGNYNVSNLAATRVINFATLTATPFLNVSASGGGASNFALNATAGGGASCRSTGIPGLTPTGTSQGYLDMGAVQSGSGPRAFAFS